MNARALTQEFGSPLYVYEADVIRARCRELKKAFPGIDLYYACKSNENPEAVRIITKEGFGVETMSPREVALARKTGVPISRIAFTCGSISEIELVSMVRKGIRVHLDSLVQVERFGKNFPGREISVRLNQGIGAGHHAHVITGGPESKFGIDVSHIGQIKTLAKKYDLKVTGLHQHIGSDILDEVIFLRAMDALFETAMQFPELEHLDFGGGFGVPYTPGTKRLNIVSLGKKVRTRADQFTKKYGRTVRMSFEPGRYLIAEAVSLLVTVQDIKKNPKKTFVGIDSGMGHLIRPSLYDSYHEILNATHPNNSKKKVTIAGVYCESGDVFAKDRPLPMPALGDVLIVKNAGAYGYAMSSEYNLRERPAEVLLEKGKSRIIRKRGA
ncbi:MAG TPA: diaminopimelate decarboxylase [Candidatus Paceibacterota bacterium]